MKTLAQHLIRVPEDDKGIWVLPFQNAPELVDLALAHHYQKGIFFLSCKTAMCAEAGGASFQLVEHRLLDGFVLIGNDQSHLGYMKAYLNDVNGLAGEIDGDKGVECLFRPKDETRRQNNQRIQQQRTVAQAEARLVVEDVGYNGETAGRAFSPKGDAYAYPGCESAQDGGQKGIGGQARKASGEEDEKGKHHRTHGGAQAELPPQEHCAQDEEGNVDAPLEICWFKAEEMLDEDGESGDPAGGNLIGKEQHIKGSCQNKGPQQYQEVFKYRVGQYGKDFFAFSFFHRAYPFLFLKLYKRLLHLARYNI